MAEGLLLQARIEAQLFDLHVVPVDLRALVRTTVRDMRQLVAQRAQRITVHCPARMERVDADGRLLRQALINLLQNASRHTTHGGAIEIRVLDNDDDVVMSVLDDGDGMSAEDRARLFQRFALGAPRWATAPGWGWSSRSRSPSCTAAASWWTPSSTAAPR